MAQFRDKTGRTWLVEFTLGSLTRVKAETGVDLLTLHIPDSPAMCVLRDDVGKLLDVLLVQLRPQMQERGVTVEQFGELLLEEHVWDAVEAILEGMVDYYPPAKRAALQPLMKRVISAARRVRDRATLEITRAMAGTDLDQIEREVEAAIQKSISGNCTGGSPASSASIPAP